MNTRLIMTISALVMGIAGLLLSFLPQEMAMYLGGAGYDVIVLRLMGALYFGFAMVNWTAKASLLGGIYGRPIVFGNFLHFLVGALALLNWIMKNPSVILILIVAVIYVIFAVIFGYILFIYSGIKKKD